MKYIAVRHNPTVFALSKKAWFLLGDIATMSVYYTVRILTLLIHFSPGRFVTCQAIFVISCCA